ncbi:MAG: HD domain-containing protein [Pseudomonadota bacterium]
MMLDEARLEAIETWYCTYVESFDHNDKVCVQGIDMKKEHTRQVRNNILDLGESLSLSAEELRLADTIAMLHDIGRFEQCIRYKTFSDLKSADHGKLGIQVIHDNGVLDGIADHVKQIILYAISHHNRRLLPKDGADDCMLFLKLLRDADKLDIWRFFREYFEGSIYDANHVIVHGLPDEPGYSSEIADDVLAGKMAKVKYFKNLNDLKLAYIGLIYDVNFKRTYQILYDNKYLEAFYSFLPQTPKTAQIYHRAKNYLANRLSN